MITWHRETTPEFSVRKYAAKKSGCSATLFSQIAKGSRRLTRDKVPDVVDLLALNRRESEYLDKWVMHQRRGKNEGEESTAAYTAPLKRQRNPKDHILSDWLNCYVKDASRLKEFSSDPWVVHRLLGGIATPARVKKSMEYLVREGFLRKTLDGQLVEDEALTTTTDGIPNVKLRAFHKAALEIAKRGIDIHPVEARRANTLVLALNQDGFNELRDMIAAFYERILEFAENRHKDDEKLYQVVLNLCPVGGSSENHSVKN